MTAKEPVKVLLEPLIKQFRQTRALSLTNCGPLQPEDYNLQGMPETSPPKWHLAHTTWFFETFILKPFVPDYNSPHPQYEFLFNSYYNGIGEQFARPLRGLLSRPSLAEVLLYRREIDERVEALLGDHGSVDQGVIEQRLQLGIQHEQQHQELFFTDIKYSLSLNPLEPAYEALPPLGQPRRSAQLDWTRYNGGLVIIGQDEQEGTQFVFDNETPAHQVYLAPYELSNRPVNNREFLHFIEDGGYQRPELWLADGWARVKQEGWSAPLYWQYRGDEWTEYTLYGMQPLNLEQPVCHVSAYEADAYARWCGARLPTEAEWEQAAKEEQVKGQFAESGLYHPQPVDSPGMSQLFGSVWEWTASAYSAYPGYSPARGAIGEYNGKFMANQLVLRGGSCVSSREHLRATYRNFFYPPDRWQFSGIRLARSCCADT